jgi:hypothetical protein
MRKLSNLLDLTYQRITQSRPAAAQASHSVPTAARPAGSGSGLLCLVELELPQFTGHSELWVLDQLLLPLQKGSITAGIARRTFCR